MLVITGTFGAAAWRSVPPMLRAATANDAQQDDNDQFVPYMVHFGLKVEVEMNSYPP